LQRPPGLKVTLQLHWALAAGRRLGRIPVPLYQDAIQKELLYILDHTERRFVVAEDAGPRKLSIHSREAK